MIQLAEKLGRKLPTEQQLLTHINTIPGDAVAKAQATTSRGEIFPGYRNAGDGGVYSRDNIAYWWVVSLDGSTRYVSLGRGDQGARSDSGNCMFGFPVRFLSDK